MKKVNYWFWILGLVFICLFLLVNCFTTPSSSEIVLGNWNNETLPEEYCLLKFNRYQTINLFDDKSVNWGGGEHFFSIPPGRHTIVYNYYQSNKSTSDGAYYSTTTSSSSSANNISITYDFRPGYIYYLYSATTTDNKLVPVIRPDGVTEWVKPSENETLVILQRDRGIWIWEGIITVVVDDKKDTDYYKYGLGTGETMRFIVPNGQHKINVSSYGMGNNSITINAKGGQMVFNVKSMGCKIKSNKSNMPKKGKEKYKGNLPVVKINNK
jgi:hypothetical protein